MSVLRSYIDGWRQHDTPAVLNTLSDDCLIIECYGPVYRGRQRVAEWMAAWFAAGGSVDAWEITSLIATEDAQFAEWTFTVTWKGNQTTFEGATLARVRDGKIVYLREYATTAALYDWTGTWRE